MEKTDGLKMETTIPKQLVILILTLFESEINVLQRSQASCCFIHEHSVLGYATVNLLDTSPDID